MDKFITFSGWCTILILGVLIILAGTKSMGVNIPTNWISIASSSMYLLFISSSLVILYKEYSLGHKKWLFLMALPIDLLIISLFLPYFNVQMHPSILFLFDVYVLILYSYYLGFNNQLDKADNTATIALGNEN